MNKESIRKLAIHEDFLEAYNTAVARVEAIEFSAMDGEEINLFRPYSVENGVLTIPVSGTLLNWGNFTISGLATSYDYILETYIKGMEDSSISEIVLEIDSPGGVCQGCFETVAAMGSYKKKKVTATTKTSATSAAYAIASVADVILAQPSATVGSIGVLLVHQSYAKLLEKEGIDVTIFRSGKKKAEGNPYEQLSEETRSSLQQEIDTLGKQFATLIAGSRNMSLENVLNLEAAAFSGEEGLDLGLVDKIMLVNPKIMGYDENKEKKETTKMSDENQVDATAVASDTKARIKAILTSPEAEGRNSLAEKLAYDTDMTVSQALELLKVAPQEKKSTAQDFEKLMLSTQNPEVGANFADQAQSAKAMSQNEITEYWKNMMFPNLKKGAK